MKPVPSNPKLLKKRLRTSYIAVSPEQGWMLYLLARGIGAQKVVEFGTSFGISTLYLTSAVRDNMLLDGWKDLYLPVLKMLTPKLRPRALVLADNLFTFRKTLEP
jgi:predicted O-methyltransferase YrrM